jgi:dipeptidyl aminopeptidase/acylaminoacyl peptidase
VIPEKVATANPENYITKNTSPFLLQHGTKDSTVPVQQSINFAAKLEKVLGKSKVTLDLLPGAEHADEAFGTPDNVKKVLDFLDKHLKS